jgi:hypothetical protein
LPALSKYIGIFMEDLSRNTKASVSLREEIYKIGLRHIWQNGNDLDMKIFGYENNVSKDCK